jgi:general L-amino acid transport system permease protein
MTPEPALEPIPVPEEAGPPVREIGLRTWIRQNLFASPVDAALTVVFGLLLVWLAVRIGRFAFVTARWEIVRVNLTTLLVGRYPRGDLWRAWASAYVLAASLGAAAGFARSAVSPEVHRRWEPSRFVPVALLMVVLVALRPSGGGAALTAGLAATAAGARFAAARTARSPRAAVASALGGIAAAMLLLAAFGGQPWGDWGGLLLTMFLAVGGITLSFPIGVLLALGRRSSLPVVRWVCVAVIEFVRGVPLIGFLFMSAFAIGFLVPPGMARPSLVMRALIALIVFTAAYLAEIVRGGLYAVPRGQYEAAQAVGLSGVAMLRLIVLPQALRAVIPAIVGQFITLFKDTSLAAIIGLFELLRAAQSLPSQPRFLAQGLQAEVLLFASFVYWVGCYSMSKESQRLERRLGVGER